MPGVLHDADKSFTRWVVRTTSFQRKSGQQQNRTIANGRGEVVLNIGLVPTGVNGPPPACSTGQYAIQFLVPTKTTQNRQLLVVGQQSDGTYGMWLYKGVGPATHTEVPLAKFTGTGVTLFSSAGDKLIQLADTGLTLYSAAGDKLIQLDQTGLFLTKATGTVLAELTDTGLQVRNPAGAMQVVAGRSVATSAGPLTYSSSSWGTLSGAPSVTVTAGPSGALDVAIGAIIRPGTHSSGESAYLAVSLTGAGPYVPELQCSVGATSTQEITCFAEYAWTTLTPDKSYTLGVMAWVSTTGVSATFRNVTLKAAPV